MKKLADGVRGRHRGWAPVLGLALALLASSTMVTSILVGRRANSALDGHSRVDVADLSREAPAPLLLPGPTPVVAGAGPLLAVSSGTPEAVPVGAAVTRTSPPAPERASASGSVTHTVEGGERGGGPLVVVKVLTGEVHDKVEAARHQLPEHLGKHGKHASATRFKPWKSKPDEGSLHGRSRKHHDKHHGHDDGGKADGDASADEAGPGEDAAEREAEGEDDQGQDEGPQQDEDRDEKEEDEKEDEGSAG